MIKKRKLWQLLRLGISLLSIFCFLNYWTACKPEIQTVPVAIGEARIVGRLQAGTVTLQPGTDTAGDFLIVTKALWYETYKLAWKVRALELEIEMLKAKDKK